MKQKLSYLLTLFLLAILTTSYTTGDKKYDFNKKYNIAELKADFQQLKEIFQKNHPRPYEYTTKENFNHLFDSLYLSINKPMTEREFQYFLSPIIGKIHCSHTKLTPSKYLEENINDYINAPSFKLYFDEDKAFLKDNYSKDTTIKIGAEILSVNGIKTGQIINNFVSRIHNEGKNTTWIYNRLNAALYGLFPAICDYPNIEGYTLTYRNPNSKSVKEIYLKSIKQNEYIIYNPPKPSQNYNFTLLDSLSTGIIKVKSFKFSCDSNFTTFVNKTFEELKVKKIKNLIIDVRGNIGGSPYPCAELFRNITSKNFIYYQKTGGYNEDGYIEPNCPQFENTVLTSENRFKGTVYFLIDGGCRSATGQFCALAKYNKLGTMIGEETCSTEDCNNNGVPHILQNSKLVFHCPHTTYKAAVEGQKRGNGVLPDIYLKPTVDNIINKKDTVLLYTLKTIKQTEK